MYKRKVAQDLGPNPHTAPRIRKEVLTLPPAPPPPPPPPPKRGTRVRGVRGQKQKIHWGIIFCPKMMTLQGVGHPVPYLGVSYATDPQKEGYMAYAPALDLTTLFEVILVPKGPPRKWSVPHLRLVCLFLGRRSTGHRAREASAAGEHTCAVVGGEGPLAPTITGSVRGRGAGGVGEAVRVGRTDIECEAVKERKAESVAVTDGGAVRVVLRVRVGVAVTHDVWLFVAGGVALAVVLLMAMEL